MRWPHACGLSEWRHPRCGLCPHQCGLLRSGREYGLFLWVPQGRKIQSHTHLSTGRGEGEKEMITLILWRHVHLTVYGQVEHNWVGSTWLMVYQGYSCMHNSQQVIYCTGLLMQIKVREHFILLVDLPSFNMSSAISEASRASPSITGQIGWADPEMVKPALVIAFLNLWTLTEFQHIHEAHQKVIF